MAIEKNDDPLIYQNLGLRRGNSFTRGVKNSTNKMIRSDQAKRHPQVYSDPPVHIVIIQITNQKNEDYNNFQFAIFNQKNDQSGKTVPLSL